MKPKMTELYDLVGSHDFGGVYTPAFNDDYGREEAYGFILDGTAYTAVASKDDGYRSHMKELRESELSVIASSIPVLCVADQDWDKKILHFYDARNGKLILSIGTDSTASYYPTFIFSWRPENLIENEDKEQGER